MLNEISAPADIFQPHISALIIRRINSVTSEEKTTRFEQLNNSQKNRLNDSYTKVSKRFYFKIRDILLS